MSIALLATGDEIISGDTLNTTTQEIARTLSSEGFIVHQHMSCTDEESQIKASIAFLAKSHNTLIITGGLGPTSDDRTRFALAKYLGVELEQYQQAIDHINNLLRSKKLSLSKSNLQQTLFPHGATLLPNPYGTAMGCFLIVKNTSVALLPGPPRECLPMFHQHLMPLLSHETLADYQLLKWRVFGLAESEIASEIDEAVSGLPCETGYRLDMPYIECKVRCKKEVVAAVNQRVEPIVKPHIISSVHKKASEELVEFIIERKTVFSITDNATGGRLQSLLQQPQTYSLIHFKPQKPLNLHFEINGMEAFWQQNEKASTVPLHFKYQQDGQSGKVEDILAFRSPNVILLATEWSAFRLFQLIKQLHQ